MARPLLTLEGVAKGRAGRVLFEDVTFELAVGDRAALVGPNGCGKSTLFALLTGREAPDHGGVRLAPHTELVSFDQHPTFGPEETIQQALAAGAQVPPELASELSALEARLADPALYESPEANEVLARYGDVQRDVSRAKVSASTDNALVEALGFTEADAGRKVASLSGGERTRLFLARTLSKASPGCLLLLDEPTNHLDVETIEWLEEWLQAFDGALLVVAHDRAFLDNVATRTLAFERDTIRAYVGNYEDYEAAKQQDAVLLAARREREAKELDKQKAVIEQFKKQKRFNGQMASRMLHVAKLKAAVDKTPDPLIQKVQMQVGFPESFKSSNDVIRIRGLGKKYGERVLFYGLDLDIRRGERLAIVGPNGAGKTTLLRVLTGKEKKDVGTVEISPGTKGSYFAQGHETITATNTLRQEVLGARPGVSDEDARALLGRFGFRREDDLQRKVSTLSGGERSRIQLLKTILTPSNLLILDEPTNHLDLLSREALAHALNAYTGALVIVSHDRWFLDSVVDKVAVLARKQVKVFAGGFTDARLASQMEDFSNEKPRVFNVKKAFKDFDAGVKHTVGSTLKLTDAELAEKRVYRTALSLGWMAEEA
ncbi:MAG TPA: ABC-F family ATP-binding cassette domain-containing protein [Candidatus Thermoplasmatota archaeon]|nr:ABC-F family ATP-binding cassette domain-containing protein [Candidatus Thermoplasmatota archaeon]